MLLRAWDTGSDIYYRFQMLLHSESKRHARPLFAMCGQSKDDGLFDSDLFPGAGGVNTTLLLLLMIHCQCQWHCQWQLEVQVEVQSPDLVLLVGVLPPGEQTEQTASLSG